MTLLQLLQRLHIESGASGTAPGSTIGLSGEPARLLAWIQAAWVDIQTTHQDWQFLRKSTTFATVNTQPTYSPSTDIGLTDFGMWVTNSFRNYNTSSGISSEVFMSQIPYDEWRNAYQFGAFRITYTRPLNVAIGPNKEICLGPVPTAEWTIVADYYSKPVELSADADEPAIPSQYHMMIVWRALMFYGSYESAPDAYSRGLDEFTRLQLRLDHDWLIDASVAGALA